MTQLTDLLPTPATSLVGRDDDIVALSRVNSTNGIAVAFAGRRRGRRENSACKRGG